MTRERLKKLKDSVILERQGLHALLRKFARTQANNPLLSEKDFEKLVTVNPLMASYVVNLIKEEQVKLRLDELNKRV